MAVARTLASSTFHPNVPSRKPVSSFVSSFAYSFFSFLQLGGKIMARIPDKIKDIDGLKETLKLAVRIIDLWFVGTPDKSEQAEMIIVDSNFLEYLNECQSDDPIIVLLTHARIKEAQGSYPPSVSNSLKASKLLINQPMAKIQEFKHRYRLEVMVSHKEESTKFLLLDRECAELIGQSTDEVNKLKIADGDVDINASPEALDKLLGYVLAFKVKVQPKFRNVVVLKYSRDLTLINTIIELLPDAEQSLSGTADHDPLLGLPLTPTKWHICQECDDEARSSQISPAQLLSNKLGKHAKIE
ncbi:hypothetical protein JHK86_015809 [Glycine max]|nr:hypothetical protein JHK86_015809 [Glycine max]